MITEEHLKHWLGKIDDTIGAIQKETHPDKVRVGGVSVQGGYVSFEYIQEKLGALHQFVNLIREDMTRDKEE